MAEIKTYLNDIKKAIFGRDVRDSIHDGIEKINEEVENTTNKQNVLESIFNQLIINAGNSNAEVVSARVKADGTSFAQLRDRLNDMDIQISNITLNIKNLGAKGDGVTDDTEIFKSVLDTAYELGGTRLFIPKGTYLVNGLCDIYSNTYIEFEQGAKIIKNEEATTSYLFVCGRLEDKGTVGYGGGAKNVIIKNGTFEGYLDNEIGISFSFNHMENFTLENCTFYKAIAGGHALDLCGCKDIYIRNCRFEGMQVVEGRGFTEAIQIDNSWDGGLSNDFANYDNLPTINVYVENCSFIPLYNSVDEIEYPCPTPLGSHWFMEGHYFKNINFINNYVENYQRLDKGHWGGCIRLYSTQELNIKDNYFKNTKGSNGYAIAVQSKDIDTVTQVSSNINISNNIFEGFNYSGSGGFSVIRIFGERVEGGISCKDIIIQNNKFIDCHIGEERKTENVCVDVISLENTESVKILNNYCNNIRRLVYSTWGSDILIQGNTLNNVHYVPFMILSSSDVNISKNTFNSTGHTIYMSEVNRFVVASNIMKNCEGYLAPNYSGLACFKTCSNGVIHNNICAINQSEKYELKAGYSLYTNGKNISVVNNVNIGFNDYEYVVEVSATQKNTTTDDVSVKKYEQ